MPIQQWELAKFQSAATELCYRLGEDPYGQLDGLQRWQHWAIRMRQDELIREVLMNFGLLQ